MTDRYCSQCTGQSLDDSEEECRCCPMCPQARTVGKCPGSVIARSQDETEPVGVVMYAPECRDCPRFEWNEVKR